MDAKAAYTILKDAGEVKNREELRTFDARVTSNGTLEIEQLRQSLIIMLSLTTEDII